MIFALGKVSEKQAVRRIFSFWLAVWLLHFTRRALRSINEVPNDGINSCALCMRARHHYHHKNSHTNAQKFYPSLYTYNINVTGWQSRSQAEVAKIDRLRERQGSFSANRGIYLTQSVACKYS